VHHDCEWHITVNLQRNASFANGHCDFITSHFDDNSCLPGGAAKSNPLKKNVTTLSTSLRSRPHTQGQGHGIKAKAKIKAKTE